MLNLILSVVVLLDVATRTHGSMNLVGEAHDLGGECYRLTDAGKRTTGGIWSDSHIDINQDFEVYADLYLGSREEGADGIAFVIQGISNEHSNLRSGASMGYANINSVIAVEVDTKGNGAGQGDGLGNYDDPGNGADHIQIRTTDNNNGWFPLSDAVEIPNIEDAKFHPFKVVYTKATNKMEVYLDGELKLTQLLHEDGISHYLANYYRPDKVNLGFTASTTGAIYSNTHTVCFSDTNIHGSEVCNGPIARVTGDPHMTTFDGLKYDCQGAGEFVIAKSLDSGFEVRGRFQHLEGGSRVTVTRGVAFNTGGVDEPTISLTVRDEVGINTCDYTMYVNGVQQNQIQTVTNVTSVYNDGSYLTFMYMWTGISINVGVRNSGKFGCVMSVQVCIPPKTANGETIVGLLGTPNNNREDDWTYSDGTDFGVPLDEESRRFGTAYDYCVENWCVVDSSQTMFEYDENDAKNFDHYNKCPAKFDDEIFSLYEGASTKVKEACLDDIACIIETVIGTEEDARNLAEVEEELTEIKTAPLREPPNGNHPPPTESPTVGAYGDPHIKMWTGEKFDFHGACDLVLFQNPKFANGLGMSIHIRTKFTRLWSYISSAVIRIGDETFEVSGEEKRHWTNKIEDNDVGHGISGYPITKKLINNHSMELLVSLDDNMFIELITFHGFVRVNILAAKAEAFKESTGLMGNWNGKKMARDNVNIIDDNNEFGLEWQVLVSEPQLFHNTEGIQAPQRCALQHTYDMRRRLGESIYSYEYAASVCSRASEQDRDECIFDVMATNDKNIASAY